jgi:hypothetical protein
MATKSFYYLKRQEDESGLLDQYSEDDVFVAYDETKYTPFTKGNRTSEIVEFSKWYNRLQDKHHHEVIFGNKIQRVKFDIDSVATEFGLEEDDRVATLKVIMTAIVDELKLALNDDKVSNAYFLISDSSSDSKISYHITTKWHAVSNHLEAKLITDNVLKRLDLVDAKYRTYIDNGVNSHIHNFRLFGSHKVGSDRYKKHNQSIVDKLGFGKPDAKLGVIQYMVNVRKSDARMIPDRLEPNALQSTKPLSYNTDAIPLYVIKLIYSKGFSVRGMTYNSIICNRTRPSHCDLCNRVHTSDNTMVIGIKDNAYYERCWKSQSFGIFIPNPDNKTIKPEIVVDKTLNPQNEKLKLLISKAEAYKQEAFANTKSKVQYDEPKMREYEFNGCDVLVIKAQMKLGKTQMLKKLYNDNYKSSKVAFVSFRKTFSQTVNKDFPDFVPYDDLKGSISLSKDNKIICQVESLHRMITDTEQIPDLLILDEIESILAQFSSTLHSNLNHSFSVFKWLLTYAKQVVIMDANISNRTYNVITNIRKNAKICFHDNQYKQAQDDKYEITTIHKDWLSNMMSKLDDGKRIVITSNSKGEADALNSLLVSKYPTKEIRYYNADTPDDIKKLHFSDVNTYWNVDILIYTPTITAGCSYTNKHFDYLFSYMTASSVDVETARQMNARVRDISSKTTYMLFGNTVEFNNCIEPKDLIRLIEQRQLNDIYNIDESLKQLTDRSEYDIARDGVITYNQTPFFNLWINNICFSNKSKNNFNKEFINQLIMTGAQVKLYETIQTQAEQATAIQAEYKEVKVDIKVKLIDKVANAGDLTEQEAHAISVRIKNQEPIEQDDKDKYEKWKLCQLYNIGPELATTEFVETYNTREVKGIYKRVKQIMNFDTIDNAINDIRTQDKEQLDYNKEILDTQANALLTNKENISKHSRVINLIRMCGFEDIKLKANGWDDKIKTNKMRSNFDKVYNHIQETDVMNQYNNLFGIGKVSFKQLKYLKTNDTDQFYKKINMLINSIITPFYGVRVYKRGDNFILCTKKLNKLFSFSTDNTELPYIVNSRI